MSNNLWTFSQAYDIASQMMRKTRWENKDGKVVIGYGNYELHAQHGQWELLRQGVRVYQGAASLTRKCLRLG